MRRWSFGGVRDDAGCERNVEGTGDTRDVADDVNTAK